MKFYIALVGNFDSQYSLKAVKVNNYSYLRFKLLIAPEYQKIINQPEIEAICHITRPETQPRFLNRHFDQGSPILLVGYLKNDNYGTKAKGKTVFYVANLTSLNTNSLISFT